MDKGPEDDPMKQPGIPKTILEYEFVRQLQIGSTVAASVSSTGASIR